MRKPRLVLHPGMGKTGTTTLQRGAFRNHSEIFYIGKDNGSTNHEGKKIPKGYIRESYREMFGPLLRHSGGTPQPDKVREFLQEQFESYPNRTLALLSWEGFAVASPRQFEVILTNLMSIGYPLSVVFVIRNILDWLPSTYLQKLPGRFKEPNVRPWGNVYMGPFISFESWMKRQKLRRWAGPIPPVFENIRTAIRLLGRENVEIAFFENLKSSPESFFNQLSDFLQVNRDEFMQLTKNVHANPRITEEQVEFIRQTHRSIIKNLRWRFGPRPEFKKRLNSLSSENSRKAAVVIPRHVVEECAPQLRKEYAWLAETTGMDVEAMGYYIA